MVIYQFFFSRHISYKERIKDCRSIYVHSNRGSRAASLRPNSIWSLLDRVLFSLLYSRLQPGYIPPQRSRSWSRRPRDSQCSLFMASMAFIVGVCLCKSFERIFCAVFMVNGYRGAKKRWYKDALQTSFTEKAGNNDIHSYLCPFIRGIPLTRIYMATASLNFLLKCRDPYLFVCRICLN